jgi:predicted MFS family arabinose efflux permease
VPASNAAAIDRLGMPLLYAVALLAGTLTVFASVAYVSYLPSLVERADLADGNGKLEASRSGAQIVGPGLGGALIGIAGAPVALVVDAASFLFSALLLGRIRTTEPPPHPRTEGNVWREIGEGLGVVRRHAVLRPLVLCTATTEFFAFVFFAVYVLYFIRELGLSEAEIGLVFATGGVGALIGAVVAAPLGRRYGQGPSIVVAQLLFGISGLVIPLAALFPAIALEMVVASEFAQWLFIMVVNVNAVSLRQALTPDRLRGRVNASFRFLVVGPQPLGSLLGGALGGLIGLPWTLVIGELGMLLAVLWLVASPLLRLREADPHAP